MLEQKGVQYQHALIITVKNALFENTCIVCHSSVTTGDDAVLFDKGPHAQVVLAAHGSCVSALARHLISDREMARMFAEYRQTLQERYRVDT